MCCVYLSLGCGLIACSNCYDSNDDLEKESSFEDVISSFDSDAHSDSSVGESDKESEEDSEKEFEEAPEGDINAGTPNPEYGNGDIPF